MNEWKKSDKKMEKQEKKKVYIMVFMLLIVMAVTTLSITQSEKTIYVAGDGSGVFT